jgi:signal transduction histidine kinase
MDHPTNETLVAALEREQARVSHQLHDTACQSLAAMSVCLDVLARRCASGRSLSPKDFDQLRQIEESASREIRGIMARLTPLREDPGRLRAALEDFATRTSEMVPCTFEWDVKSDVRDLDLATSILRITHEAVLNAVQHAQASHIQIRLAEDQAGVVLTVVDDGKGAGANPAQGSDEDSRKKIRGQEVMRRYAATVGGELSMESPQSGGTKVWCRFGTAS